MKLQNLMAVVFAVFVLSLLTAIIPRQARADIAPFPGCPATVVVQPDMGYSLEVTSNTPVKNINGSYWGFNQESPWLDGNAAWDSATGNYAQSVLDEVKTFQGGTFRFPGGTPSNYIRAPWLLEPSKQLHRVAPTAASWGSRKLVNGFDQFHNNFLKGRGTGMVVVNIVGQYNQTTGAPETVATATLADEHKQLVARYLDNRVAGSPTVIFELGNEVTYANFQNYDSTTYFNRAAPMIEAGRSLNSGLQYAVIADIYNVTRSKEIAQKFLPYGIDKFVTHFYTDQRDVPAFTNAVQPHMKRACALIQGIKDAGVASPKFIMTEYGTVPGKWSQYDYKATTDMQAAISDADLFTAYLQVPEYKTMMLHNFSTFQNDGRWASLQKWSDGTFTPNLQQLALKQLRWSGTFEVLPTQVRSDNFSGYSGGYDLRGVVLRNAAGTSYTVFTSNRAPYDLEVNVKVPALAGKMIRVAGSYLSGYPDDSNVELFSLTGAPVALTWPAADTQTVDAQGNFTLSVPGTSVQSARITVL